MPELAVSSFQVPGFQSMGVACGIKQSGRPDVALIVSEEPDTTVAMVSTQNPFAAAPVHVSRQHAANGQARAIVINSGNANACTGRQGLRDALTMARDTAEALGLDPEEVMVASTGIIGEPMPMDQVRAGIKDCAGRLGEGTGDEAAHAILTTDSGPKQTHAAIQVDGRTVTVAGIAKGAGMIHPNMATMLGFITTDASVPPKHLRHALQVATGLSFNQISVDGCESTNDMVITMANGRAGNEPLNPDHPDWGSFQDAVTQQCQQLAKMIAADGEGATRLLEVVVDGAANAEDARIAARAVVSSDLVKAAVHGSDPNWGRIVAAAGQTRIAIDPDATSVFVGPANDEVAVLEGGTPTGRKDEAHDRLTGSIARLRIHIGTGDATGTAWGCDLTPDYVTFNADYST